MNKFLITTIFASAVFLLSPSSVALAALSVQFQTTPLFLDADVKPGDQVTRTVTVSNTGGANETVRASVQNQFTDGLADVMLLTIAANSTTYFSGSFSDFFALSYAELGTLLGGNSRTYTFTASLPTSVGNPYQLKTLGFDLLIGFVGGEIIPDTPGGGGGGGGGGSSFRLFNEAVTPDTITRSATITWQTNRAATTYLVCADIGLLGPVTLSTLPPLFGYDFVVPEVDNALFSHSVTLNNLAASTYECRPVSRERLTDPFTTGIGLQFSFPGGLVAGVATTSPSRLPSVLPRPFTGSVLGVSKGTLGGPTYEEWRAEIDAERAAREATLAEVEDVRDNEPRLTDDERLSDGYDRDGVILTSNAKRIVYGLGLALLLLALWLWWYNRRS